MKRMSKTQIAERDKHQASVQEAWAALDTAVTSYNDAQDVAWAKVEDAKGVLSEKVQAANEWRDGIESDARAYYDDRSEKWQEGEAGQSYSSWLDSLGVEVEDPSDDISEPEKLDAPDDPSDAIGDWPESPDEA